MSNQNLKVAGAMDEGNFSSLSGMTKWEAKREVGAMVKRTIVSTVHEQGRAHLTNIALENVGALSALEEHLIQVAPIGEERYRHIVDAYALGASQKIARR